MYPIPPPTKAKTYRKPYRGNLGGCCWQLSWCRKAMFRKLSRIIVMMSPQDGPSLFHWLRQPHVKPMSAWRCRRTHVWRTVILTESYARIEAVMSTSWDYCEAVVSLWSWSTGHDRLVFSSRLVTCYWPMDNAQSWGHRGSETASGTCIEKSWKIVRPSWTCCELDMSLS